MLTEDPTIDRDALAALVNEYGIRAARFDFLRVGADGHNYQADGGGPWFVSVKRTMSHREAALDTDGLERAYRAARRLRDEARVDFQSPAVPRTDGRYVSTCAGRPAVSRTANRMARMSSGHLTDPCWSTVASCG